MGQKFSDYFDRRTAEMGEEGQQALRVFEQAYELGAVLADARKKRHLTQRELSKLSGVQQADISRIERGTLSPTTPTFLKLTRALGGRVVVELVGPSELDDAGVPAPAIALVESR